NQLIECVCGQELVNYFEMQSALQHLLDQKLIKEDETGFSILPEGAEIAHQLEDVVSPTVRRYAYNMAVNLLGTYVHTNRLQYLEFFGKFFEGGGREFSPLKYKSNYVNLK
ncbi:MAG: DUF4364 family protein, partial [Clostridia bacterium]|nr:DUF4364 family protein [Clostridia bacterium]